MHLVKNLTSKGSHAACGTQIHQKVMVVRPAWLPGQLLVPDENFSNLILDVFCRVARLAQLDETSITYLASQLEAPPLPMQAV